MSEKKRGAKDDWIDPDDAPEWTDEMFDRAEFAIGPRVVREATGTLTKRGRPPVGDEPKQQVTLRLDPKVVRYFKRGGEGWQTRLNEALEKYVVRSAATGRMSPRQKTMVRTKGVAKKKA